MTEDIFIRSNAKSYHRAYKILAEEHYKQSFIFESWFSGCFFPLVTILTFGIELHIKWLLFDKENRISENVYTETHSLNKLFHCLNKPLKKQIVDKWFIYFKLRGGQVKSGTDKYKFFNTFIDEFHDTFEAMRYVHEDYIEKRDVFELLLILLEPLLFSFTSNEDEYTLFINNIVNRDPEKEKKNLIFAIQTALAEKYNQNCIRQYNETTEQKDVILFIKSESERLSLNNRSCRSLFDLLTNYSNILSNGDNEIKLEKDK